MTGWLHEVKFDGYRVQLHEFASIVTLYSKGGRKFMRKFPELTEAVAALPVRSCVMTLTALPITSAGGFWPFGHLDIIPAYSVSALNAMLSGKLDNWGTA